ncbi:MAG: hypothetical protein KJ958_10905 [Gammaproteobacteria bacterium]|nr:hypothetical protein [Gammaproteobacteria bacterium]MBU1979665.1 hypothetical protein [Gammaproteobacteria bacterium]
MSENNSLVATYANHSLAKATVKKLHKAGLDLSKLSIVGKDENKILQKVTVVGGLNELGAEQYSCVSRETIPDYEAELKADRLLLFFHGTADEISQAKSIIDTTHPEGWNGNVGCSVFYGCLD